MRAATGPPLALLCALAVAPAGCDQPRQQQPAAAPADALGDASRIAAILGSTPAAAADAALHVRAPGKDAMSFHLHFWCSEDGRIKLAASKDNVDFCIAVLSPNGGYSAWLPREHLGSRGTIAPDPRQPMDLASSIRLAAAELTGGPLPADARLRAGPDPRTVLFQSGGFSAQALLDPDQDQVATKVLFTADQRQALRIAYARYEPFDSLRRATNDTVSLPDGTAVSVQLWHFQSLPRVGEEHRSLQLPADCRLVPLADFLDRLQHLGD